MSSSGIAQFIPLILIFVIFYFFLIRPQQKKIKEHKQMVASLKRGDQVVTSGGIIGKIERVFDDEDSIDRNIDCSLSARELGSYSKTSLSDGIEKTVNWLKSNPNG